MKFVLVDTSVWSLAFRKKKLTGDDKKVTDYLTFLIRHQYAVMIGPIRQDYEKAAEYYNLCRAHGIQGSHIDFLICSTAHNNNFSILTLDKDFTNYKKYVDIELTELRQ